MKKSNWLEINKNYWNGLASKYNSLYNDEWSLQENNFLIEKLQTLLLNDSSTVLDLGCGTGLGCGFCELISQKIEYIGLDISVDMLNVLKKDFPKAKTINTKMSDLKLIESNSINTVISIFTSFSYTDDVEKTISEIKRVLKPNGTILVSVLSRYSLRRICGLKFGKFEHYKSRGTVSKEYSEAWDFTINTLQDAFSRQGFKNIEIKGYNTFAGFSIITKNLPELWRLSLSIANFFPSLSHELILTSKIEK